MNAMTLSQKGFPCGVGLMKVTLIGAMAKDGGLNNSGK